MKIVFGSEFILRIGILACLHEGSLTATTKTHLQIEPSYGAVDF